MIAGLEHPTGSRASMSSANAAEATKRSEPNSLLGSPVRLEALRTSGLLDSNPEERFDRLTRLAAHALDAPVSLVSLVTENEQFFKSCFGLQGPIATDRRTPLGYSFCKHVVIRREPLIISDAREHPLVRDNPAIIELGVVSYAGIPLILESGEAIGSFCVLDNKPRDWSDTEISMLRDLAASVVTEISLKIAKDRAEAANTAKDRFLAILSHELRMPLSPCLMVVASMANDPELPQAVRDDAALVQRNIEQQARLIDDLLDITRIEKGKLALRIEAVDIHESIRQSVGAFGGDSKCSGVAVSLELNARNSTVSGDSNRLKEVFQNLLKNALKFTPKGGSVVFETQDAGDKKLRIKVRDTGVGGSAGYSALAV